MVYKAPERCRPRCRLKDKARRSMSFAVTRKGARGLLLALAVIATGLSACTTVEGTNALSDLATFEREVMRSTLQGVGVVERGERRTVPTERGPLVVPTSGATPPPPREARTAALPTDSAQVQIDARGLSQADIEMLRSGRVIGSNLPEGRPLTEAESRQLAARMQAYREAQGQRERSIYTPPESYFSRVGGQDLVCLAANGDLVPLSDPRCPPEVRARTSAR